MTQFTEDEIKIMKNSGQIIGHVADEYISEIYQLDRVRNSTEFKKRLKDINMRAISIGKEGDKLYLEPITKLQELINNYEKNYDEIKDIVLIYSTFYLSAIRYSKSKKSRSG